MSPAPGYAYFTESPIYGGFPLLDDVPLDCLPFPVEKLPGPGVHVLTHANGTSTLQVPYQDDTSPEETGAYEFRFELAARTEGVWWHVEKLWKQHARFYFIPWAQEEEVFLVGVSLTTFELPRTAADAVSEHGDIASYPTLAWLDDVAQTVIASGAPGTGEVKVVGRDVTTPTLTAGQVLRVRYLPEYPEGVLG